MIAPNQHEKNEWSRLATDAYAHDRNDLGHRFSMAAAYCTGDSMETAKFDFLQSVYRVWLIDGLDAIPDSRKQSA